MKRKKLYIITPDGEQPAGVFSSKKIAMSAATEVLKKINFDNKIYAAETELEVSNIIPNELDIKRKYNYSDFSRALRDYGIVKLYLRPQEKVSNYFATATPCVVVELFYINELVVDLYFEK